MPNLHQLEATIGPSGRTRRRRRLPPFAALGAGSTLAWPWTVTAPELVSIGAGTSFGPYAYFSMTTTRDSQVSQGLLAGAQAFDPRLTIGDRCRFGRDVTLGCLGRMAIGDEVFFGDRILVADTYHDYRDVDVDVSAQPMRAPRDVLIADRVFVGSGAVISPGVTVGAGAVVCAGAVVTRHVAPGARVLGAPAAPTR